MSTSGSTAPPPQKRFPDGLGLELEKHKQTEKGKTYASKHIPTAVV